RPFPRQPAVERDLALVVEEGLPAGELTEALREIGSPLVVSAVCFDVYRGPQVPTGHKSLAVRLTLQAPDRTLTDAEIDRLLQRVTRTAAQKFGASLRT
ncbi:MAG TPA: phenylalanine--tRNA ligase subunit beta, partial [Candidatus Nitrosotenuis sp.]|nr:phenylalanine--tRNA ligase subunit beta [Candidatus Nitrosotenuis sp.]